LTGAQIAILAVDGGNSKTDVALVTPDGELRAIVHGPTISHQQIGLEAGMARLAELVTRAASEAGLDPVRRPIAEVAVLCLAGADYPIDVRHLTRAARSLSLGRELVIRNDGFAGLRAGTNRSWGVAVICGSGMNCVGLAPDGRSAAFPAVGDIAGDWGGGSSLGHDALAAAIRGRDGRGPQTRLEVMVPAFFGYKRPADLTYALYRGAVDDARLRELAPLVFDAAGGGDPVARQIIDHLADEVAAMASAMLRRLRLVRLDVEVVLAGGIMRAADPAFYTRIEESIQRTAKRAQLRRVSAVPVLGAALIGLDRLHPPDPHASEARLREALGG
jgi:N-acetylglucosamine kinase-like BadF-type ATPase